MYLDDDIVALATPIGIGGISIVRISGKNSIGISEKIIKLKNGKKLQNSESHKLMRAIFRSEKNNSLIDDALIVVMRAPNSYTGENTVEFHCHGGYLISKEIINELMEQGARHALPGEFTKRSFLNGKIDLTKAEALNDLINARSKKFSTITLNNLSGALSIKIKEIIDKLVDACSFISASIDFPDEIEEIKTNEIIEKLTKIENEISKELHTYKKNEILKNGISVSIIGKPNVGKSSILNSISGFSKSIVCDIPGTTRDIVETEIKLNGLNIRLNDTAGMRETDNIVEKMGVQKSLECLESSDLILFVLDANNVGQEDFIIWKKIQEKEKTIVAINKIDIIKDANSLQENRVAEKIEAPFEIILKQILKQIENEFEKYVEKKVFISTKKGYEETIDTLEKEICEKVLNISAETNEEMGAITTLRQKNLLDKAFSHIKTAKNLLVSNITLDCVYMELEEAIIALKGIIGNDTSDDIIDNVFSNFCVGK